MKILSAILLVAGMSVSKNAIGQGCGVPSGQSVTIVSTTSTQLDWNAVPGASLYNLEIQNATGNPTPFLFTTNVNTNTYTISGLTSGANYKFKVRTRCGGTKSNWSAFYFFTSGSGQTQCTLPANLTVNNSTATSANISWNAAAGALSYRLRVEDGQNNPVAFLFATNTTQTSFTVSGLTPSTNYKAKVRSNCGGLLHSAWTAWTPFTTAALRNADLPAADVKIYPNPANEVAYLVLPEEWTTSLVEIKLTDMSGKTVYSYIPESVEQAAQFEVPLSTFPQGIYILSVNSSEAEHHQRLSIVH